MKQHWRLPFTPEQRAVFFESTAKFRIVQKGGRVGLTLGAALAFIMYAAQGKKKALWGDTTHGNTLLYWEDYFEKVLTTICGPEGENWSIVRGRGVANILGMAVHFRYAQNPKNWEGQSYDVIFLNEAGIILNDEYIWTNAVLKSVMQYPKAFVIAAGVPKGTNKFSELIEQAKNDTTGRWQHFHFTAYDNPFNTEEDVNAMSEDMGVWAAQEVMGEVVDGMQGENQYIPLDWVNESMSRLDGTPLSDRPQVLTHSAIDPSLGGDTCVFGWRYGHFIPKMSSYIGGAVDDPAKIARKWLAEIEVRMVQSQMPNFKFTEHLKRVTVALDFQGPGSGVFSAIAHELAAKNGINTSNLDANKYMAAQYPNFKKIYSTNRGEIFSYDKQWKLIGERIQMLDKVKAALDPTGKSPLIVERDPQLKREITAFCYHVKDGMRIELEKKEETKKRINGKSPGQGDVMMYLFSQDKTSSGGMRSSAW